MITAQLVQPITDTFGEGLVFIVNDVKGYLEGHEIVVSGSDTSKEIPCGAGLIQYELDLCDLEVIELPTLSTLIHLQQHLQNQGPERLALHYLLS